MTRRLLLRGCALLLVWQMMPGTGAFLENAVHLLREGHLAHALPDVAHRPVDAEHDCSGPNHFCPCHTGTSFVVTEQRVRLAPPAAVSQRNVPVAETVRPGYRTQIFRPPVAA